MNNQSVLSVYDFEVRADKIEEDGVMYPLETLASIGVCPIELTFGDRCKIKIVENNIYYDVFPTLFTNEQWRDKPLSSSVFFDRYPTILPDLEANGHVVIDDEDEYYEQMLQHSIKYIKWFDGLVEETKPTATLGATDTSSSDWGRLSSLMTHGKRAGPPYNKNNKWNGFRQLNYDQHMLSGELIGLNMDTLNQHLEKIPIKRNHRADIDAHSQAYEAVVTLLWTVGVNTMDQLFENGCIEIDKKEGDRLQKFLSRL